MKRFSHSSLPLLVVALIIFSCHKDDDVAPTIPKVITKLLTVSVDASFKTSDSDNWIVIHDGNGDWLTYKPFESNTEIVLDTDTTLATSAISVTTISRKVTTGNKSYEVRTYTNVEKGQTLKLIGRPTATASEPSAFLVNVSGAPGGGCEHFALSDKFGRGLFLPSPVLTGYNYDGRFSPESPKAILTVTTDTDVRYQIYEGIVKNDTYPTSYAAMKSCDQKVDITFPSSKVIYSKVSGREPGQNYWDAGYVLRLNGGDGAAHTKVKFGYVNALVNYETTLQIGYEGYYLTYNNVGGVPSGDVKWPDAAPFIVNASGIRDFDTSGTFLWRYTIYDLKGDSGLPNETLQWFVYSPDQTHSIRNMPTALLKEAPALAPDNARYSSTTYITDKQTYKQFTDIRFSGDESTSSERVAVYKPR